MKSMTIMSLISILAFSCTGNSNNTSSTLDSWDFDKDKRIDHDEFTAGYSRGGYYDEWDDDKDLVLNVDEWNGGIEKRYSDYDLDTHGRYADWDKDMNELLDKEEVSQQTFDMWDVDDDGYVESNEFEKWYYGVDE